MNNDLTVLWTWLAYDGGDTRRVVRSSWNKNDRISVCVAELELV
jgi:hypothetical protein